MAATLCAKFLLPKPGWLPMAQSVRHGSKSVTRHKRPIHILKKKMMAVTQYMPPVRAVPPGAYPAPKKQAREDNNPLMLVLKREVEKVFAECRMVAVVQNNACNAEDMMVLRHRLYKHGIIVKFFPNQVTRSFLTDSMYSNMSPLFIGPTVLVISKEPKAKEMLTALRASPQMTLLGACIDGALLSAQGVQGYSRLPSVTLVQGELVSGLTMLSSHTASLLQRPPTHLAALLAQYVKQQQSEPADTTEEKAT